MKLPSWLAAQKLRPPRGVPSITLPVRDSPTTASGWRELACEYTCIPDACYPWDAEVLRALQAFCPDIAPIWVRWTFLSPREGQEEIVTFGRHAIGRRVKNLRHAAWPLKVLMPSYEVSFPQPNILEYVHMGEKDPRAADLPGAYLPFDWGLYALLRSSYRAASARDLNQEVVLAPLEARRAAFRARKAEEAREWREFSQYVTGRLDQVSEVELKEGFMSRAVGGVQ